MKRLFFALVVIALLIPAARLTMQDVTPPRVEITGVNPTQLPTVTITANVFDRVGQPVFGLTKDNFVITGELADKATIVSVENITDSNLSFSVVLAIDTSSSMGGLPLERAQEAAKDFINTINSNDPSVAIVTFSTNEHLVQDFTSDKDVLLSAIDNLVWGGKTALYDGSFMAIQKAAESASPRRAVIILSDGAEFGGRSSAARGDALAEALKLGVPVYTIGLGYGIDRTFLKELSDGTNAKNYESPSPEELHDIYQGLATTLQSQYVITAQVNIPSDGTTYQLGVQTTTPDGSATAVADLRAPIPVPIVSLPDLPAEAISQPTDITADVKADDPITSAEFQLNGTTAATLTGAPYTLTIDPQTLPPGSNTLTFNVTDSTGDTGTATQDFQVAALPSNVTVSGLPTGDISETQTVTLDVTGQTPAVSASYSVDGGDGTVVTDAPYSFTLDPNQFAPGAHTLSVDVANQGGATAHVETPFSVAALPPVVSIEGVTADEVIDNNTTVTVNTSGSQSSVTDISVKVGDTDLVTSSGQASTSGEIDPNKFAPGKTTITAAATDSNGKTGTQTVNIEIAALPPQVTVNGLKAGETLNANRTVTFDITGQTPVTGAVYRMDGTQIGTQAAAPFSVDLDVLALGPGGHILTIDATNAGGQTAVVDTAFVVSEGPSQTATATNFKPSATPVATNTPKPENTAVPPTDTPAPTQEAAVVNTQEPPATIALPTETPRPTASPTSNQTVLTSTAQAGATQIAAQTAAADVQQMLTQQAVSAANAQSTLNAQQTADAQNAEGTLNAQATLTAEKTAEATSEPTTVAQASTATTQAPAAITPTSGTAVQGTPEPTLTSIPLTSETQTVATNNNILPIAVICIVGLLILLVVFLFTGGRRRTNQNR